MPRAYCSQSSDLSGLDMHRLLPIGKLPTWHAPRLSPLLVRLGAPLRRLALRHLHRITTVEVRGLHHLEQRLSIKDGILITPNHVTYSDPLLLAEAAGQVGCPFYYLTAWQVFGQSRLKRWLLPRLGCFSVDREGVDRRSFRAAVDILVDASHPLVVFPEGEMYHLNDRVLPFHDGAAAMLHNAGKRSERGVACVPCGVKYLFTVDPTGELERMTRKLEEALSLTPRGDLDLPGRVYRVGEGALASKEIEWLGKACSGALPERIRALTGTVLERLERELEIRTPADRIPQRVQQLRREILARLTGEGDPAPELREIREQQLEQVFLVTQLFSYPGDYLSKRPTNERVAETLERLEEDVLGVPLGRLRGTRKAILQFGQPVDVRDAPSSVRELTELLETRVQSILDELAVRAVDGVGGDA